MANVSYFDAKAFNPQAFGRYVSTLPQLKRDELIKSGALKGNQEIKSIFSSQTNTNYAVIPFKGLISGTADNYDGATDITASTSDTYYKSVVVYGRAHGFVEQDFSYDITGGVDFMDNVASQVAQWWDDVNQEVLLNILKGIFSMTGAANLKFVNNHTYDISGATTAAGQKFNETTLNSAIQKACASNKSAFTMAIMNSQVATNLENLNLLERLKYTDANGIQRDLTLASLNGKAVIIDDSVPVEEVPASSGVDAYTKYTTYVLGNGAFDYEDIGVKVPYEMSRNAAKNGGQDTMYVRERKCISPFGISFTKSSMASNSPTNAEFAMGANWELVHNGQTSKSYIDHKLIPIARIISRG